MRDNDWHHGKVEVYFLEAFFPWTLFHVSLPLRSVPTLLVQGLIRSRDWLSGTQVELFSLPLSRLVYFLALGLSLFFIQIKSFYFVE